MQIQTKISTTTRFEKEAKGNSKMAYSAVWSIETKR